MRKGCIAGLLNRITTSPISPSVNACSFPFKYLERGMSCFQTIAASKDHSWNLKNCGLTILERPHKATQFLITLFLFLLTRGLYRERSMNFIYLWFLEKKKQTFLEKQGSFLTAKRVCEFEPNLDHGLGFSQTTFSGDTTTCQKKFSVIWLLFSKLELVAISQIHLQFRKQFVEGA